MAADEASLYRDGIQIESSDGERIAYVQPDDTMEIEDGAIAEVCSKTQKANAALIAAAPDMLAEHRLTLGQLERMQAMTRHLAKTDPLAVEIADAIKGTTAIIAKAEGLGHAELFGVRFQLHWVGGILPRSTDLVQIDNSRVPFFTVRTGLTICAYNESAFVLGALMGREWHDDVSAAHCRSWTAGGGCCCDVDGGAWPR